MVCGEIGLAGVAEGTLDEEVRSSEGSGFLGGRKGCMGEVGEASA